MACIDGVRCGSTQRRTTVAKHDKAEAREGIHVTTMLPGEKDHV